MLKAMFRRVHQAPKRRRLEDRHRFIGLCSDDGDRVAECPEFFDSLLELHPELGVGELDLWPFLPFSPPDLHPAQRQDQPVEPIESLLDLLVWELVEGLQGQSFRIVQEPINIGRSPLVCHFGPPATSPRPHSTMPASGPRTPATFALAAVPSSAVGGVTPPCQRFGCRTISVPRSGDHRRPEDDRLNRRGTLPRVPVTGLSHDPPTWRRPTGPTGSRLTSLGREISPKPRPPTTRSRHDGKIVPALRFGGPCRAAVMAR